MNVIVLEGSQQLEHLKMSHEYMIYNQRKMAINTVRIK